MKMFRHIKLHGSSAQIGALREKLGQWVSTTAWCRNVDLLEKMRGGSAPDAVVFEYTGIEAPGAFVWLFDEPYGARVTNIVPTSAESLSHDEYNTIAAGFARDVLGPIAAELGIRVEVGPPKMSIEDLLPASTASALRRFSASANRATGTAHPQDAQTWDEFIIRAHHEHAAMTPDILRRWLVEDEHWNDDVAREIALKYESARRLLASNDKFKAA